jgi:zinc transporter 5/7
VDAAAIREREVEGTATWGVGPGTLAAAEECIIGCEVWLSARLADIRNTACSGIAAVIVRASNRTRRALLTSNRSWLELPEALTALLIPLPFLFASLAYPTAGRTHKLPSTLSEAVAESAPSVETANVASHSQLLHALALSSATLTLVGVVAKVNSSLQPLDRRKAEKSPGTFNIGSAPQRIAYNILSVLLPYYAAMQVGGARVALVILTAVAAGLGALDRKPGKHTPWDDIRRTMRTRKMTCLAVAMGAVADYFSSGGLHRILLGYGSLLTSVLVVPPPLPTAGWSLIMGSQGQTSYVAEGSGRASLPKPSSPLVSSFENTLLTIAAGLSLAVITILYSLVSSSYPSLSSHTIGFSTLSVASATALVYLSYPSALRSRKFAGFFIGALFVVAVQTWEQSSASTFVQFSSLSACAALVGAVMFDTQSSSAAKHAHSHGHSHEGHDHSHDHKHEHHLHGNHSRLSAFLIARTTPGSIIHSIMIEKDSRRIAYFGV